VAEESGGTGGKWWVMKPNSGWQRQTVGGMVDNEAEGWAAEASGGWQMQVVSA